MKLGGNRPPGDVKDFVVKRTQGDNCVKIGDDICLVRNIISSGGESIVLYDRFHSKKAFFTYPVKSDKFGIFEVSSPGQQRVALASDICKKYVLLPHGVVHIAIPMLHC